MSNENEDGHFEIPANDTTPTAQEDFSISIEETNKNKVNDEYETAPNENVETNQNAADEDKMNSQHESEITDDENDANPQRDYKGQNESYSDISSESTENTSYPGSKEQIIRQNKFYIHSAWLAVQSSYFRSLFFSGMKESNAKEVHVQISTNEEQAHLKLLEAMYKIDTLNNASVDELLEVLRLAHKYDVKFVFKKCKYVLKDMVDSLEICEEIMRFTKVDNTITDVEDLVSTIQSFLAKEFSPLDKTWQTTSFKELCEPSLKYLLSSDELVTVSENTVFHALMYWIEERGIENVLESQELPPLLSVVRFELIPVDYLHNNVQHNSVAKKLMDFTDHYLKGISYHALSDTMKQRLPHQPVKRKIEMQPFVPFTWVIPTHKLSDAAFSLTDKTLKSEEFWYCGYKMRLVISDIVKNRDLRENLSTFKAKLSLEICNLTEESEVSIRWQPTSECFESTPLEQIHTFDKKTSLSSVNIKYEIEVRPPPIRPVPSSNLTVNFGTPSAMPVRTRFPSVPSSNPTVNFGTPSAMPVRTRFASVASSNPTVNFGTPSAMPVRTRFPTVASSNPTSNFGTPSAMPVRTRFPTVASSNPTSNFGTPSAMPVRTRFPTVASSNPTSNFGTPSAMPVRTRFPTVASSNPTSNFGTPSAMPVRARFPSVASSSPTTVQVCKSASVTELESPNSPCMYIDVKMKLV